MTPDPRSRSCFRWAVRSGALLLVALLTGCSLYNDRIFLTKKEPATAASNIQLPFEDVWFKSGDGQPLNGWFIDNLPGSPRLLFFHGNDSNLNENLEYLRLLHDHGFAIFIFDYRGYGKSQGTPRLENDLYQDARGAISYLEGRGWRPGEMIYFGQSLGGAVALQMSLEKPPAGLVLESTFTSMGAMLRRFMPTPLYLASWWSINLRFDNLAKIGKVRVPLLLFHGDQDRIAPVAMARRLFARANNPKTLRIIQGGGHCDASRLDLTAYLGSWDGFLSEVGIGGGRASPKGTPAGAVTGEFAPGVRYEGP